MADSIANIATSQINQTLNTQELDTAKRLLSVNLPFETKLLNIFKYRLD